MSDSQILFFVKQGRRHHGYGHTGLATSAGFVVEMLVEEGIAAKLIESVDGNDIDRHLARNFPFGKPSTAILEAFWVTPEKLAELRRLHPYVRFIVRSHSKPAFLAQEGIAFEWALAYAKQGVEVASNSRPAQRALEDLFYSHDPKLARFSTYLPNYYGGEAAKPLLLTQLSGLNIGCFGAVRPFKNHINQALAAIQVADVLRRPLLFHINATRVEGRGEPVLKTLEKIFHNHPTHKLVSHSWLEHPEFLRLIASMDVVTQVSYSETFNVVTADAVVNGVPCVVSPEIDWLKGWPKADPNSVPCISKTLFKAVDGFGRGYKLWRQKKSLRAYNKRSKKIWLGRFDTPK